jgi:CPA1 family monovalent cation:H+ antiporter
MPLDLPRIGLILLLGALVTLVARRIGIPYAAGLVLAGLGLGLSPLPLQFALSRELVFYGLLPPLVFEAAVHLRWSQLRRDLPLVTVLATVGVVLAAVVTAAGMVELAGWPLPAAVLFGFLIAATDPVSVIATFKDAGVGGRLRLLLESESLLNDGTAAVATGAALAWVAGTTATPGGIALSLLTTVGGGLACGAGVGVVLLLIAGRARDAFVEITLTTLAAYGSFLLAESWHLSGILAAVAAGLVAGNAPGLGRGGEAARSALDSYWEYVAFTANSVIFLMLGSHAARQLPTQWFAALVAIALVMGGRALAIYPLCALFARSPLAVERRHQHVLVWGGLRGALALALALGLPETLPGREAVVTTTFAVVLCSILVQGLSMTALMRRLGILPARTPPA